MYGLAAPCQVPRGTVERQADVISEGTRILQRDGLGCAEHCPTPRFYFNLFGQKLSQISHMCPEFDLVFPLGARFPTPRQAPSWNDVLRPIRPCRPPRAHAGQDQAFPRLTVLITELL